MALVFPLVGLNHIFFFFQAEDGIRDKLVTGVQTCALPISHRRLRAHVLRPRREFRVRYWYQRVLRVPRYATHFRAPRQLRLRQQLVENWRFPVPPAPHRRALRLTHQRVRSPPGAGSHRPRLVRLVRLVRFPPPTVRRLIRFLRRPLRPLHLLRRWRRQKPRPLALPGEPGPAWLRSHWWKVASLPRH